MALLPFYGFSRSNYRPYVFQNPIKSVRMKRNVVENKLIDRKSFWIRPHFRWSRTKSHFSGSHFDDKFSAFGVARVCIISCWNHISSYHTRLKPYLACQFLPLHCADIFSWMSTSWYYTSCVNSMTHQMPMMTSSNGNFFCVTGPLCG